MDYTVIISHSVNATEVNHGNRPKAPRQQEETPLQREQPMVERKLPRFSLSTPGSQSKRNASLASGAGTRPALLASAHSCKGIFQPLIRMIIPQMESSGLSHTSPGLYTERNISSSPPQFRKWQAGPISSYMEGKKTRRGVCKPQRIVLTGKKQIEESSW